MKESKTEKVYGDITVKSYKVFYGDIGIGGSLGYEHKKVSVYGTAGWTAISAHAPSTVVIKTNRPIDLMAAQNGDMNANFEHIALVDGKSIGGVKTAGQKTKPVKIEAGEHTLEFQNAKNNGQAHTLWLYRAVTEPKPDEPKPVETKAEPAPKAEESKPSKPSLIPDIETDKAKAPAKPAGKNKADTASPVKTKGKE